jgi:squalene-hopene/tetraprenyl-beta-curcumene cyclase
MRIGRRSHSLSGPAAFLLVFPIIGLTGSAAGEEPLQYEFGEIRIPVASADEPVREELSVQAAVKYLEEGARAWNGARGCVSCHTNGTWMLVRPALSGTLGPPPDETRQPFVAALDSLAETDSEELHKSTRPAQVIYVAAGLAEWDRHVTGRLSKESAEALELMFSIQLPTGTWGALDCWPPYESDAFHLATVAAMGVAAAPGWLEDLDDPGLSVRVDRLKRYLRTTEPPHDYGRLLLLWAAARMPDLLREEQRRELIERVWTHQRPDGGWSIRTFADPEQWGRGNRAAKLRNEPEFADPPSDGHLTGLAIVVLREAGIEADDPRIRRGVEWLRRNQRISGRWWTRSLNTDRWHFITYSGTAFPLWALDLCEPDTGFDLR